MLALSVNSLKMMGFGTSTLAGGVVINEDACIIPIDFYTAHQSR